MTSETARSGIRQEFLSVKAKQMFSGQLGSESLGDFRYVWK